jgi:hypothetical protein
VNTGRGGRLAIFLLSFDGMLRSVDEGSGLVAGGELGKENHLRGWLISWIQLRVEEPCSFTAIMSSKKELQCRCISIVLK